ncbi:hypothetical protein J6590_053469 [Homalodisca vitripennis]|nr:hypothetical protein J6590_053469 [Homalodisca vitripennis]
MLNASVLRSSIRKREAVVVMSRGSVLRILHLDLKCHPYKLICYVANELDGATTEGQQFPMRYIFIAHEEKNYSYWTNKTLLMLFTS